MKRKLAVALAGLVLGATVLLGYRIADRLAFRAAIQERISTMPDLGHFIPLAGDGFEADSLADGRAVILLYFNSGCKFCAGEIEDILDHPDLIAHTSVILISSEPDTTLRAFQAEYKLRAYPYVQVLQDTSGAFYRTFGTKVFPSAFVYSRHRKLLEQYRGQVRASALYRTIAAG